jgi:hypothetical protein
MIVVMGDSWGVGEWGSDRNGNHIIGPSITQLLTLHCQGTINLCQGGGSNTLCVARLQELLERFCPTPDDVFYWIVTDPVRCVPVKEFVNTCDTLENKSLNLLDNTFKAANALAAKHHIKINLIGGLCDLNNKLVEKYDNLILKVPSWLYLLNENYTPSIFSTSDHWVEVGTLIHTDRPDLKEEFIQIADDISLKQKFIKDNPKYFINRDSHPNRVGHKVLKDFLYPELSHLY